MPAPPENGSHEPPFVNTGSRYKKPAAYGLALLMLNVIVHTMFNASLVPDAFVQWIVLDRYRWPGAAEHQLSLVSTLVVLTHGSVAMMLMVWLREYAAKWKPEHYVRLEDRYQLRWITIGVVALFVVVQNFDFVMTIDEPKRAMATNDIMLFVWGFLIAGGAVASFALLVDPHHFNKAHAAENMKSGSEKRL